MTAMTDCIAARLKLVNEHVRHENDHNLEAIMGTFGATAHYDDAHYDDEPWTRTTLDATQYARSTRDCCGAARIADDVLHTHVSDTASCSSRHSRTAPGTVARAAGNRRTDRASALRDLYIRRCRAPGGRADLLRPRNGSGLFHEPVGAIGRITALLTHR